MGWEPTGTDPSEPVRPPSLCEGLAVGGSGGPFVWWEDKEGPAHPGVRQGIVTLARYSWTRVTHVDGPRAGAGVPGMHSPPGGRVLGRAEQQMATAFNARRPSSSGPG